MVAEIASSAWDAVLTEVERKTDVSTLPKPMVVSVEHSDSFAKSRRAGMEASPELQFNARRAVMLFYIGLSMMLTSMSVWVMSWSW